MQQTVSGSALMHKTPRYTPLHPVHEGHQNVNNAVKFFFFLLRIIAVDPVPPIQNFQAEKYNTPSACARRACVVHPDAIFLPRCDLAWCPDDMKARKRKKTMKGKRCWAALFIPQLVGHAFVLCAAAIVRLCIVHPASIAENVAGAAGTAT